MKIRKVLIVVAVLFLSVVLIFGIQIANYLNKQHESDTNYYATEACMPQFAYVSDRYGMVDYNGSTYYAFETKKYSSIEKLCEALPAGCGQAGSVGIFHHHPSCRHAPRCRTPSRPS